MTAHPPARYVVSEVMRCHVCAAELGAQDKFCSQCGARITTSTDGSRSDLTPPSGTSGLDAQSMFDPITGQLRAVTSETSAVSDENADTTVVPAVGRRPLPPPTGDTPAFGQPRAPAPDDYPTTAIPPAPSHVPPPTPSTTLVPAVYEPQPGYQPDPYAYGYGDEFEVPHERRKFRLRPLLLFAVVTTVAAAAAMLLDVVAAVEGSGAEPWRLNDLGTNLTVAGIIGALAMLGGSIAWCYGFRWGAGLTGGAGAGLAGWAALPIGLAEWPITENAAAFERGVGYWALAAVIGLGIVTCLVSLIRSGDDGRAGLDPWVAALGAMATVAAVVGPLIPIDNGDLTENWTSPAGIDLPTFFFAARALQLGLLLMCGVIGFLLVRRFGLGFAIGGTVAVGWLTLTSATGQTELPVAPAYVNPGAIGPANDQVLGIEPYVVTTAGVGLIGFFAVVAVVMALLSRD